MHFLIVSLASVVYALPSQKNATLPTLFDFSVHAPKHNVQFPVPSTTLDTKLYEWQEPDLSKQSRSPCPMLNTLANHGMLPRDGKSISAEMFADALKKHLNLQWDFWWVIAKTAMVTVKAGNPSQIDLHDLAFHNGIQHDAALTRNDKGQGQYFTRVNKTLVDQLISLSQDKKTISFKEMALARRLREGQSEKWNPNYSLPGQDKDSVALNKWFLAIDQAAVPILVLSDTIPNTKQQTGKVPIDRLKSFFYDERLPFEYGWTPAQYELSAQQVFDGIKEVSNLYRSGPDTVESPTGLNGPPEANPNPDY